MKENPVGTWYYAAVNNGYELWYHGDGGHMQVGMLYDQATANFICERCNEPSFQMVLDMGEEKFKEWYADRNS